MRLLMRLGSDKSSVSTWVLDQFKFCFGWWSEFVLERHRREEVEKRLHVWWRQPREIQPELLRDNSLAGLATRRQSTMDSNRSGSSVSRQSRVIFSAAAASTTLTSPQGCYCVLAKFCHHRPHHLDQVDMDLVTAPRRQVRARSESKHATRRHREHVRVLLWHRREIKPVAWG